MSDSERRRILIVDDECGMRRTLRRIMVAKGYDVRVAGNGQEAIEIASEFDPEMLLLDIRMPGIDGVETFQRIKKICPDASVIFMTAYLSSELSDGAKNAGAVRILSKPIDIDHMCELVAHALNARTVLLIDDDPGFCRSLQRALGQLGFKVNTAAQVEDAIRQFSDAPESVVLLDMRLQDASGLDVMKQIRRVNKDVAVVLMTGFEELQHDLKAGLDAGACCSFVKPFDVDELVEVIRAQGM